MRWRKSKGQSMTILAIALPVMIGAASLATDIANFYYNWFTLQKGADSAVLSGAGYLPALPDTAISAANSYAATNGIKANEIVSVQVSNGNTTITMKATRTVPFSFARVFGLTSAPVTVTATAQVQAAGSGNDITPFGIDYRTDYTFGQQVQIKAGQVGPGNWEPLALGGTGASNYLNNIENGYQGTVKIGDWVQTEPGVINGPTKTGVDYKINLGQSEYPTATYSTHTLDDPRIMVVPMVDFSNINGSSDVPVKGFAVLWIEGVHNQGNGQTISTVFLQELAPDTTPSPGAPNFGAVTPVLIG